MVLPTSEVGEENICPRYLRQAIHSNRFKTQSIKRGKGRRVGRGKRGKGREGGRKVKGGGEEGKKIMKMRKGGRGRKEEEEMER